MRRLGARSEDLAEGRDVVPRLGSLQEAKAEELLAMAESGSGLFQPKGVGEGPPLPPASAIADAIYDAVGIRIKELPIAAERVLRALKEAGKGPNMVAWNSLNKEGQQQGLCIAPGRCRRS